MNHILIASAFVLLFLAAGVYAAWRELTSPTPHGNDFPSSEDNAW